MDIIGIIITIATIVVVLGIGVLFLIRYLKKKKAEAERYDYTTKHGTRVMLSPQTKGITPEVFEMWSDSIINFWHEKKGWSKEKCYKKLAKTEVELFDAEYLERGGYKAYGVMWSSSFLIEISTWPKDSKMASVERVASLYRHEYSHVVCGYVGNLRGSPDDNEFHHKIFKEVRLGA